MIHNFRLCLAASLSALLPASGSFVTAAPAFDSASDPAYAAEAGGAWKGLFPGPLENPPGNDNGGFGFSPWDFSGGFNVAPSPYGNLNHFIDGVDFPTTSFNDLGAPAFGLSTAPALHMMTLTTRPFAEPLKVGQIFSADIDTPAEFEDSGHFFPSASIHFSDANGATTLAIQVGSSIPLFGGDGDIPWQLKDATRTNADFGIAAGGSSIASTATSDGSAVSLEVTSATAGRLTLDGLSLDVNFIAGLPNSVTFTLFDNNAEGDAMGNPTGEHAFYFNNLQIVPEPSAAGLLGVAGAIGISRRRRRVHA